MGSFAFQPIIIEKKNTVRKYARINVEAVIYIYIYNFQ